MRFIVVSGLGGAGKSQALNCLEDMGFFCADNLPPEMLPILAQFIGRGYNAAENTAVVIDVRSPGIVSQLLPAIQAVRDMGIRVEVLFLDARNDTIINRYNESRRPHPLQGAGSVLEAIEAERDMLKEIRSQADHLLLTDDISIRQLRDKLNHRFGTSVDNHFRINIISFGYKRGLPIDTDLMFDMRFLVNPFYEESLRNKSGLDDEVFDYVMGVPVAQEFLSYVLKMVLLTAPMYTQEGKNDLTIGIGCTGGRHRSPSFARALYNELLPHNFKLFITHRDLVLEGENIRNKD